MPVLDNSSLVAPPAAVVARVAARFDARIDGACGVLRIATSGVWTLAQAERHVGELDALIAECRDRFGRVRVLIDRRGNPVQPEPVAERLYAAHPALFGDDDRLALVVDSSLVKGRVRQRLAHAGAQAFLSYHAAEKWLTAWS